jgi:hypothetical protein
MDAGKTKTVKRNYEIGGLCTEMTEAQAARWNAGEFTTADLRDVMIAIPQPVNDVRFITLRRAMNEKLEKEVAAQIEGMPANRCS